MKMRNSETGFSLIEALVALTVLSVAVGTLLAVVEDHVRIQSGISDRALARWIAENRLVELGLGMEDLPDVTQSGGREWWVETTRSETPDPDLIRVDIAVGPGEDRGAMLATLTGFVIVPGGAS